MADKTFRIKTPGASLDPVPPSKKFVLYMKDIDAEDAVDSGETITFPLMKPDDGVPLFLELQQEVEACESPLYHFYYGYNPSRISPGSSVTLYIVGGVAPFDWATNDANYSFNSGQTSDRWNTITADASTGIGDVTVTITDACGNSVIGVVHNSGVLGSMITSILDSLFGNLDEDYFTEAFTTRLNLIETNEANITAVESDIVDINTDIGNLSASLTNYVALSVYDEDINDAADGLKVKTAAALTTLGVHQTALNELVAEYMVKLDVDGYISGFGIVGQEDYSEAVFWVDRFKIVSPGVNPKQMFAVGTVDGITTVGINGNLIVDGSILTRHIGTVELDAEVITAGILQSADGVSFLIDLDAGSIDGRAITIRNSDGTVLLASGGSLDYSNVSGLGAFATLDQITLANISTYIASAAIGTAYIANAAITNAKIDNLAVTQAKIALLAVDTAQIANAAIDNTKIGDAEVTNIKIYGEAYLSGKQLSAAASGSFSSTGGSLLVTHNLGRYAIANGWGGESYGSVTIQNHGINSFNVVFTITPGDPSPPAQTISYAYI